LTDAIHRAVSTPATSTTRLAFEAGFADGAHLARAARELVGYSSTTLLGRGRS